MAKNVNEGKFFRSSEKKEVEGDEKREKIDFVIGTKLQRRDFLTSDSSCG